MVGSTVKEMTTNFGKLDKFEGHDFRRWQKNMHFLLTTLKVVYVLTTPMPELLEDDTVKAIRRRAKWENDDYIYRGHILNNGQLMEQFNELLRILGQYTQHGLKMDESIFVSSVIDKLPLSWKDFKHSLKHGKDDLSLVRLDSQLRIKESIRTQDSDKGKGKEVVGPSVNMIEEGEKNKNNKQNKGKKRGFKDNNDGSGSNKKPKLECWKCSKTGHFKRDCRSGNKKNNASLSGSGKGSKDQFQDQGQNLVHVWNRFIKYSISLIFEAFYVQVDAIAWWIDSGATTHVCKDRCWFKTYEPVEDIYVLYMGDDHLSPVHGKGSVVLEFSSRKSITLFNVLYVPKLRFGYYNNGMFMLNLNKVPDDSAARKGTAVILNRDPTAIDRIPIKIPLDRAPVISIVVRLPDPKRKTLGEKTIDCIFVGYVEHSKAYKFYVIEPNDFVSINIIIESRDAIFDVNRFSSIPRPKDIIPNSDESQIDDHSNDVSSETLKPRKGKRVRKAKSYGYDFSLYLVEGSRDQIRSQYSYCYSIEEDPRNYNEAMQSRDVSFWKKAIDYEISFIMENT
ncbi:zinc finger, CCHC-type containing protein [Tanacetum coccineum]